MKLLKGLVIAVALLGVVVVGVGFALPSTARIERSIEINSPPATVFVVLNSFKRFQEWSPWKKYDPNAQITNSGPDSGIGAKQSWASPETGDGSQEIISSTPFEKIEIKLAFGGFENDTYVATYQLKPVGANATQMTWSFDAQYTTMLGRYFGLVLDGMLGADYEEGLANLKALVETLPTADFSKLAVEVVEVEPQTIAFISGTTSTDVAAITTAYAVAYSKILAHIASKKWVKSGAPLGIARKWDEAAKVYEYDAGIPIEAGEQTDSPEVKVASTYAGRAIRVVHRGSYESMASTYDALFAYSAVNGFVQNGNPWEVYVSEPTVADAVRVTEIYLPIK